MRAEVRGFIIHARNRREFSGNSVKAYYYDLKLLTEYLANRHIYAWFDVTHDLLTHYLSELKQQGYKRNTLQHKGICFHAFFEYLKQRKGIRENPAIRLVPGRQGRSKQTILPCAVVGRLIKTAQQINKTGVRDALIIGLLYYGEMHVEDLVRLSIDQLRRKRLVSRAWGGQVHDVSAVAELSALIDNFLQHKSAGRDEQTPVLHISERQINNILKNVSELTELNPPATPMTLRNSFLVHKNSLHEKKGNS